jgi:DNA-binding CsgD family transcriptional regulator
MVDFEAAAELPLDDSYRPYLNAIPSLIALHRDDRSAADDYLRDMEMSASRRGDHVWFHSEYARVARSVLDERDGKPAAALARLLSTFDPDGTLEFSGLGVLGVIWLPDVVRLAQGVGEAAVANAAAVAAGQAAAREPRPTAVAVAQHCQGLVASDPLAVLAAAEKLASIGYPLFHGQALENAAVIYAEQGDARRARLFSRDAIEVYNQIDAAWDILRVDTRLRQFNIRRGTRAPRRRRPTSGWEALTPMEQKVARMVARGQSNPDIAIELFLSRHTIESHVSHILTKLNAKSRVEIARAVAQRIKEGKAYP